MVKGLDTVPSPLEEEPLPVCPPPHYCVTTLYKEFFRKVGATPAQKNNCQGAINGMSQFSLVSTKEIHEVLQSLFVLS